MAETYHKETFNAFTIFFRNGCKTIYEEFSVKRKVPLKQVLNAMIEAAYNNLSQAIIAKYILTGECPPDDHSHAVVVKQKELIADKLMGMLENDLSLTSPNYIYSIWRAKRIKKNG